MLRRVVLVKAFAAVFAEAKDIPLNQIAARMDGGKGIHPSLLSKMLSGERPVSRERACELARILEVPVSAIWKEDEE